ncbi:MAG: glutathione S-transferase N-terminal domain-containing protein, partial [Nitrosomonadaceae bacterium]|nr:glutathione S-transferase N-terminal domain-containing protein [Nitrosomonadaceae bacterium]
MALKLYYFPGNASLAPHILLEEMGVPFELVLVDRDQKAEKSPEYLKLNPAGVIPTLADDDAVICETAAILLHLAAKFPDTGWIPPL